MRELANVVEHASILCDELPITGQHLPHQFAARRLRIDSAAPLRSPAALEPRASVSVLPSPLVGEGPGVRDSAAQDAPHPQTPTGLASPNAAAPISLRNLEMQAIYQALERNGGNKPKTAEELGISLKTLYNKLNQGQNLERSA